MRTKFLLPGFFKNIGWMLFIPALIAIVVVFVTHYDLDRLLQVPVFAVINDGMLEQPRTMLVIKNGISDEILMLMLIFGAIMVGFSKLRNEDEFTSQIRYESLVWALYVNCAVMAIATIFIYGMVYLNVMMLNMFTVLLFFVARFHIVLYKFNQSAADEE